MKTIFIYLVFILMLISTSSCVATFGPRPAPGVVVIQHRPAHYKIVKIKGKRYYHWNNNHYQRVRGGYILIRF
jgi:hypothetical protein